MSDSPAKDPDAELDYAVDWSVWLPAGDTISTSTWAVIGDDASLTIGTGGHAPSHTTTLATVWLLGGTLDKTYQVANHIVTAQGRTNDHTLFVKIRQQ